MFVIHVLQADLHYFKGLLERVVSSWRREVRRADEMALRAEAHSRTMLLRMVGRYGVPLSIQLILRVCCYAASPGRVSVCSWD